MRKPKTWRTWTTGELRRLAELREAGKTAGQCAAELGRSFAAVKCRIAEGRFRRSAIRKSEWIEALCRPHTIAAVAERFGVTIWAVKRAKQRLRDQGMPIFRIRAKVAADPGPRLTAPQRKLAAAHLDLAGGAAKAFARKAPHMADAALSAALAGLCAAAMAYDADRGIPFAGFARRRIAGAILDAAREELPKGFRRNKGEAPRVISLDADLGDGTTLAGLVAAREAVTP